ncbi:MAG: adenylyl-sulfate kinase [Verrucomicrobia bacterium]|nr:adenylyl-sulfate kinase [Verrucomicrobiota bacterium]
MPSAPPASAAPLRLVICGSVDHGKSTLVGRLLAETGTLPEGKVESVRAACARRGVDFEWAFLTDALQAERDQNVTIDSAQIVLKAPGRDIVLIDAPGHEEFLRNMITGAATAEAALLLVAADEGWRAQSRRHAFLLGLLGLRRVAVVVTKMDRVDYSAQVFRDLRAEGEVLLGALGLEPFAWVGVSARSGAGVTSAGPEMPWQNATVLATLTACAPGAAAAEAALRFVVQDVYRQDGRRLVAGRVESGRVSAGDAIVLWPFHKDATVASIERWPQPGAQTAGVGESIALTLAEPVFVERGYVLSHPSAPPAVSNQLHASIFWIAPTPLALGAEVRVKLGTQQVAARVASLGRAFDPGREMPEQASAAEVPPNGAAEVVLQLHAPLVFDRHDHIAALGRFVLLLGARIGGGGIVTQAEPAVRLATKSANITESAGSITAAERTRRHGHRGAVVWLTGLSGAGKSTLARGVERELFARGSLVTVLDGDNLRRGLNSDLGFAPADRVENIRRAAEAARLLAEAGCIVLVALISPYRADRAAARRIALEGGCDFAEVFVRAPLAVCEQRDPKQLYRKARAGLIKQFTGIDAPYEEPEDAEIVVRTDEVGVGEATELLVAEIVRRTRA